ncbi:hypothetical protein HYY74_05485 [Candidatus Woesearchaeota archaeon]|nr:hypothetical protein [Candidatus Woesearchaeota archaeon]
MKLTKAKLIETLRVLNEGESKYQARKIAGVTKQRVYQVWKQYDESGIVPVLGNKVGRPKRPITDEEHVVVREVYERYRLGADALERLIERDKGVHLPHNHIHRVLLGSGLAEAGKPGVKRKQDGSDTNREMVRHI